MTVSILNDLLLLKNSPPEKTQEYLTSINLNIFDPIFHNTQKLLEAQQKVLFILCAYSEDSPLIILRQDSKEEKEAICEYLQIPDYMRGKLMNLTEPEVRRATTQYLSRFAGPLFKSLMFMKIQYEDFELNITNREFGSKKVDQAGQDGAPDMITYYYDIKEHGKAIAEHARLGKQIDQLEKQIKQQVKRMEGIEDLKEFARNGKESGSIKGTRMGNVETTIK